MAEPDWLTPNKAFVMGWVFPPMVLPLGPNKKKAPAFHEFGFRGKNKKLLGFFLGPHREHSGRIGRWAI